MNARAVLRRQIRQMDDLLRAMRSGVADRCRDLQPLVQGQGAQGLLAGQPLRATLSDGTVDLTVTQQRLL